MKFCEGTESLKTLKSMQNVLSVMKNIKHQFTANIFQFYDIFLKQPYNQRDLLGRGCILKTTGVIKKNPKKDRFAFDHNCTWNKVGWSQCVERCIHRAHSTV